MEIVARMNCYQCLLSLACVAGVLSFDVGCSRKSTANTHSSSNPTKSKAVKQPRRRILPAKPADGIRVDAGRKLYRHETSQTAFRLPDGWNAEKPKRRGNVEFLRIADSNSTAKADITWTPLAGTLHAATLARVESLRQPTRYGEFNVSDPKPVTIGPKTGWRIDLKVGLEMDAKKREILYYFATAPGTRSLWRIGIRVTLDKNADDHIGRVLVNKFVWTLPRK